MPDDPISSMSNVMYVVWSVEGEGQFRLTWTQIAAGDNTLISNQTETLNCTKNSLVSVNSRRAINISSPGYPYGYGTLVNCQWTLVPAMPGYHVSLFFLTINLEDSAECLSDYVKVSSSKDMALYKAETKLCNANFSSQTKYHGTPYLKLEFISDWYNNGTGFNSVVRLECGGDLTLPTGTIDKDMAQNEPPDTMCEWSVILRPGRTIKITFNQLNMRKDANGHCDSYIMLRNGHNKESPYLGAGQYCGNTIPEVPNTIGNHLFVQFYTGSKSIMDLFSIRYQEESIGCDATIVLTASENSTVITSPNYPQISNAFSECTWKIIAPHGELLQIDFLEHFDLTQDNTCSKEVVELRDGATEGAAIIGRFCTTMPSTQTSTSNVMSVRFFTQVPVPKNGFKAKVSVARCGGFYRGESGQVQSTNYPGPGAYPSNSICDYRIVGRTGSAMNITFVNLDLPPDETDCTLVDHVTLYNVLPNDENDTNSTVLDQIGTYCGNELPSPISTMGSEVIVRFVSLKPNNVHTGFRLTYNTMLHKCGGDIVAATGVITSPGYPIGRTLRQFCEWRISVPKGSRVRVDFDDFDMFPGDPWPQLHSLLRRVQLRSILRRVQLRSFGQRLTFYNDFSYMSRIQILQASDRPTVIQSSDNKMLINLWMRTNVGHRGFKLTFTSSEATTCIGNLDATEGTLRPPINASSYYCEYQRRSGLPLIGTKSGVGTMALRIRVNDTIADSSLHCLPHPIPIMVTYTQNTRATSIIRNCNTSNAHFERLMAPFQDMRIVTRNALWMSDYTIDYKIHNCGGIIDLNDVHSVVHPTFSADYGEVACAWQFKTMDDMKMKVSLKGADKHYPEMYLYQKLEIFKKSAILIPTLKIKIKNHVQHIHMQTS